MAIANVNLANFGDNIIQPGSLDGGINADDAIATLTDFEPLDFVGTNTIDAGVALSTPSELGFSTPTGEFGSIVGYGTPSSTLHPAYGDPDFIGDENMALLLAEAVQKVGRTTVFTMGSVNTIDASVSVCYNPPSCTQTALFVDQIIIGPAGFSSGGDSGSLIVADDGSKHGVGLLFAGNGTGTIANRIDLVLTRFNVSIDDGLAGNLPPTADAGPDQTVVDGDNNGVETIQLDGSGSFDPDGSITDYTWREGGNVVATGVAPSVDLGTGLHVLTLTVTDNDGLDASDDVQIEVLPFSAEETVSFVAAADTYIDVRFPSSNYGNQTSIQVSGGTAERVMYLRIDLAGLPLGAVVTDARIELLASNTGGAGELRLFTPGQPLWDETLPTWLSPLAGVEGPDVLSAPGTARSGQQLVHSGLESVITGNGPVTFVVRSSDGNGSAFRSSEYGTPNARPRLVVTYTF